MEHSALHLKARIPPPVPAACWARGREVIKSERQSLLRSSRGDGTICTSSSPSAKGLASGRRSGRAAGPISLGNAMHGKREGGAAYQDLACNLVFACPASLPLGHLEACNSSPAAALDSNPDPVVSSLWSLARDKAAGGPDPDHRCPEGAEGCSSSLSCGRKVQRCLSRTELVRGLRASCNQTFRGSHAQTVRSELQREGSTDLSA